MKQVPTIGRVVHYVLPGGTHRPAIVAGADEDGACAMTVFTRGGDRFAGRVTHQLVNVASDVDEDPTGKTENTWHWPERERGQV